MRNLIFPEHLKQPPKRMRGRKDFSIIATPEHKEVVNYWHCRNHPGVRLISVPKKGYLCPQCGISQPGLRIVDLYEEKEAKTP